jgi:uncharacterized repeat protein (TIGR01451 family)
MKVKALFSALKRSPKLTALAAVVVAAIVVPTALLAWGPDRPTYTMASPADHITFDSITDNPAIGDERNFVGIREVGSNEDWNDTETVQAGKQYMVRMYVHNNAASNLNLVAHNVTATFNLPTNTASSMQVNGFINSSNATPNEVYDSATFASGNGQAFNLQYQTGTLLFANNVYPNGTPLPESIFTSTGAKLGYNQMDGNIPGCNQYSGWVSFIVKPQFAQTTNFTMSKEVRKSGDTSWSKSVNVNKGDTVDYEINYQNTGDTNEDNVVVNDYLPAGLTYVPNSTYIKNSTNPNGLQLPDGITASAGINIGDYNPQALAYIKFSAKVTDTTLTCGTQTYVNKARVTIDEGYKEDTANVVVTVPCQPGKIQVCNLATKQIQVINESDFDSKKYSKNLADCNSTPVTSLPETGINTGLMSFIGLGVATAGVAYAVRSDFMRRLLQRG